METANLRSSPLIPKTLNGRTIDNGMSTQLVVRLQGVDNARAYEMQVKNGTGGWQPAGVFTQARGVGGSMGYSDWSDPGSHMVI